MGQKLGCLLTDAGCDDIWERMLGFVHAMYNETCLYWKNLGLVGQLKANLQEVRIVSSFNLY